MLFLYTLSQCLYYLYDERLHNLLIEASLRWFDPKMVFFDSTVELNGFLSALQDL